MTTQYQNQPQQFHSQPGAQGVSHPQQAVPGQNPQQPGAVGAQQGAGFAQPHQGAGFAQPQQGAGFAQPQQGAGFAQPQQGAGFAQTQQGVHHPAGVTGPTGVAGPHTGFAGTGTGTSVDDSHSGGCFGKSNNAATAGTAAGSTAASNRAQTDAPTGGTKEKIIGAMEYALGTALGSESLKAKGLEKEREGDALRAQLHETQQQYHRGRGDAHGAVAQAFRNQNQAPNQAQTNQFNAQTGGPTTQYPGAAGAHGGQLGANQNAPQTNQDFATAGAAPGAFAGPGGTMAHGGQLGANTHTNTQAQNQAATNPGDGTRVPETHNVTDHGIQSGVNNPGRTDLQNTTQTGNTQPPPYGNTDNLAQDNKPNVLQKPNPNPNVAV